MFVFKLRLLLRLPGIPRLIPINSLGAKDLEETETLGTSTNSPTSSEEVEQMESIDAKLKLVKRGANLLIYASVFLGATLLAQLYALMVLSWLFYSILAGWILYLVVAVEVATGRDWAYPPALVLSITTLAVSLPQPEHYFLAEAGLTLASLTFILGSLLQVGVIALITSFLILKRKPITA